MLLNMIRFPAAILACLFMLFQESVQVQQTTDFYQLALPSTANNFNFETTRNKRQVQGIFKTVQVFDDLACIHECGRDPVNCNAVNFKKQPGKGRQDCELLDHQGRKDNEMAFEDNNDYDFIVMMKIPQDCSDIKKYTKTTVSGVYHIRVPHFRVMSVSCDFNTNDNGWTILQRRIDGSVDFYRDWANYKRGFGNKEGSYWLGLDNIHALTSHRHYRLRIDLEDFSGERRFAVYETFNVAGEDEKYRLTVGGFSGNAGDSLSGHNNMLFSTKDRDNDIHATATCANLYFGGWWYTACHSSNLNGLYLNGPTSQYATGVVWSTWHAYYYSLKTVVMKIQPRDTEVK